MVFATKKLNGVPVEVTQIANEYYAKIKYQPFDKYIIVCQIKFKSIDEENISDITIYNPYDEDAFIINEFDFLDSDGNNTLMHELKDILIRQVFYSLCDSSQETYYMNIGFKFGYH